MLQNCNAEIVPYPDEPIEKVIKRFKKKVFKSKCLEICKEKMRYTKKSDKKRMERKERDFLIQREERKRREREK